MINPLLLPELREMLASGNTIGLSETMAELHPAMMAEFSEGLSVDETWQVLRHAPIERQAEIFSFFPLTKQVELVDGTGRNHVSKLLEEMSPDDRVDLLKRLDYEVVENLMPLVTKAERQDIRALLSFPEGSAGSVMTTEYATLPGDATVMDALALLRQQALSRETIYYVYVLDDAHRLIGIISLRDLVLAKPASLVADIMHRDVISVRADEDQEKVAQVLVKYDFLAIPVVDDQHRLIGIITFDDVADILEAETTEDFHLAAAVTPSIKGYVQSNVWFLYRRRVGWLLVLVFVNLLSSGVIAAYEETLQTAIALAFFLPLLIDSGGNTGSQAATLIIRALATNELDIRQWASVVGKELAVGLSLGFTMALAGFLLGLIRSGFEIGLIVGLSMLCIVILTNLVGVLLPFVLARFRFDPAVASSPLITTVADTTGLLLYFSIATWVMAIMATS